MTNWKCSKNVFSVLRNSIIASKLFETFTISDTKNGSRDFPNYSNDFKAINNKNSAVIFNLNFKIMRENLNFFVKFLLKVSMTQITNFIFKIFKKNSKPNWQQLLNAIYRF